MLMNAVQDLEVLSLTKLSLSNCLQNIVQQRFATHPETTPHHLRVEYMPLNAVLSRYLRKYCVESTWNLCHDVNIINIRLNFTITLNGIVMTSSLFSSAECFEIEII